VFRYFDVEGNGIVLDIQRTTALRGEIAFVVNVGVLLAAPLRYFFGDEDPRLDAMPHHGVWDHRLTATDDTAELPDHTFTLSTEADADRAAMIVRAWVAANLPRMKSWLGDFDAMFAAMAKDREQSERASEEQLASGQWIAGRWPDGRFSKNIIGVFALAARGDVDAVAAEIAGWQNSDPDSMAATALAYANQRHTELRG
jgi:hypothetical protein